MIIKSQVVDYQCRGTELEGYNLLDFSVNTYEADITKVDREAELFDEEVRRGPGRPRHSRVRYLNSHPKSGSVHRIVRAQGHRNLPNFLGRWLPRNDDEKTYDFYCASMLMLLKPWRDLRSDLKLTSESWATAFESFRSSATPRVQRTLSGIQYFHECESAANADQSGPYPSQFTPDTQNPDDESGTDHIFGHQGFSEEGLALLKAENTPLREQVHGHLAIEIAKDIGIFTKKAAAHWPVSSTGSASNATEEDLGRIAAWLKLLQDTVDRKNEARNMSTPLEIASPPTVQQLTLDDMMSTAQPAVLLQPADSEQALPAVNPGSLNPDQLRAYNIVNWHLAKVLQGADIPPLRMVLYGEGGTGKSRVIQTITESFTAYGAAHMLVKAAYTGVAASLVNGKTTHVIASLSLRSRDSVTDAAKKKLQDFWRNVRYLVIDEYSMLSKTFLATLSRNIAIGKEGSSGFQPGQSFGGLNVILCGDLHQFPPVACGKREALYYPINTKDSMDAQIGRRIYEEFTTVVILKEQMRVTDPTWRDFLVHLRYGRVETRHLKMLRTLLLKRPPAISDSLTAAPSVITPSYSLSDPPVISPHVDFNSHPWNDAPLITPRHAVRTRWNQAAVQKWCSGSQQRLFICQALETIKGVPLNLEERYALANHMKNSKRRSKKDLPDIIHLAIGMKVMVTNNLQTDLDITNGARGVIVDILLSRYEPPLEDGSTVTLRFVPECVLVKLDRTRATALPHLQEGVIPIQPIPSKVQVRIRGKACTVTRVQLPMTAAYSFTDYRAQGQTIPYVIVDIASPPSSRLSLFNLYVALSRSSGRSTIRLLRDFDDDMFLQGHEPELIEEDERLEKFDEVTGEWWKKMQAG
jgi:hypothetical protein